MRNPFKPTAGATPPHLVGRDEVIDQFMEGIENGPGAPDRLTLFTGQRGVGKTVMLGEVADRVQEGHQWQVLSETATTGFLERLTRDAIRLLPSERGRRLTSITLPVVGGGASFALSKDAAPQSDFREALTALADQCAQGGTGILITLDEVHSRNSEELAQFAADIQHLIREGREVAVAFAGLPAAVDELLDSSQITFLRRAERVFLQDVPIREVTRALQETITSSGRFISPEDAELLAESTRGYPFMIQLVGYHSWRKATSDLIDTEACRRGIHQALTRLGSLVHAPALRSLSEVDRTFLVAMSHDEGPSRTSDLAQRMGKSAQYTSVYRQRLINAGMVQPVGHGTVDFAIPGLREYLRDHAASLVNR
ncbi:MAG: AAA family ATPase [bacterium]|nr:AAA family ATPase [bacterium]